MLNNRISDDAIQVGYWVVVGFFVVTGAFLFLGGILFVLCGMQWSLSGSPLNWLGPAQALIGAIEISAAIGFLQYRKWAYAIGIAVTSAMSVFWAYSTWWILRFRPAIEPLTRMVTKNLEFYFGFLALLSILSLVYLLRPKTKQFFFKKAKERLSKSGN